PGRCHPGSPPRAVLGFLLGERGQTPTKPAEAAVFSTVVVVFGLPRCPGPALLKRPPPALGNDGASSSARGTFGRPCHARGACEQDSQVAGRDDTRRRMPKTVKQITGARLPGTEQPGSAGRSGLVEPGPEGYDRVVALSLLTPQDGGAAAKMG